MGQQLQVDFGEKWMQSIDGQKIKIRFVAYVLAPSHYKWACFQTRPFTTSDLIRSCHEYFFAVITDDGFAVIPVAGIPGVVA